MKFLKNSRLNFTYDKYNDDVHINIIKYNFFFKKNLNLSYKTVTTPYNFYEFSFFLDNLKNARKLRKLQFKNKNLLINKNKLTNKLVNYCIVKGQKPKAYNIYKNYINLFFYLFKHYTPSLCEMYDLYDIYYNYSKKNYLTFFNVNFLYSNIIGFLEPTFILTTKKEKKKKKKTQVSKEISIVHIKPHKRQLFCLKLMNKFSKTFKYDKNHQSRCYALLNIFLKNRNSILFQKKIAVYNRLLLTRRFKAN